MTDKTTDRPRILVGVDGSEDGLRAVRYAVNEAQATDADLWLVHALDDGVITGGWGVLYDPSIIEETATTVLTEARLAAEAAGLSGDRIVAESAVGYPAAVLSKLSERAALVVVGRRAASGLERMFIGSTSTSLVASSAARVIVISSASTPQTTGGLGRVAVAVGSLRSDRALRWGFEEARRRKAELTIIHALQPQPRGLIDLLTPPVEMKASWVKDETTRLEQIIAPVAAQYAEVKVSVDVRVGVPIDQLIAETSKVDLLLMAVRPHPVTGVLGGPVRAVLAHALCPVGVVAITS